LFISISIAIRFSSRFFRSINNLIYASIAIGEGNFNSKVPEFKTDKDIEILNKNFNLMIDRLKIQQEKLITNERYEAWGTLARKLAHEIKNPLTPILLSIDRIKNKFLNEIHDSGKDDFKENLKIINNQIKQIENMVNEFSDFARMPKPILRRNDLIAIIKDNINFLKEIDLSIDIKFLNRYNSIFLNSDREQISRVFLNLIKNSIESIQEKSKNTDNFDKKITIELDENPDHIKCVIEDNGIGVDTLKIKINEVFNPYFTTKINGTGLGLSIVKKIINDHNGFIQLLPLSNGVKVEIIFNKNDS